MVVGPDQAFLMADPATQINADPDTDTQPCPPPLPPRFYKKRLYIHTYTRPHPTKPAIVISFPCI